jgi:O6-methylguanine-DNA--protein-cysteine methyltransferase
MSAVEMRIEGDSTARSEVGSDHGAVRGRVLVATSAKGICAILLGDDAADLQRDIEHRYPTARLMEGGEALDRLMASVVDFIEAPGRTLDLPLDPHGTAFQRKVWQAFYLLVRGRPARRHAGHLSPAHEGPRHMVR